jgi:hypothetical protein
VAGITKIAAASTAAGHGWQLQIPNNDRLVKQEE